MEKIEVLCKIGKGDMGSLSKARTVSLDERKSLVSGIEAGSADLRSPGSSTSSKHDHMSNALQFSEAYFFSVSALRYLETLHI